MTQRKAHELSLLPQIVAGLMVFIATGGFFEYLEDGISIVLYPNTKVLEFSLY